MGLILDLASMAAGLLLATPLLVRCKLCLPVPLRLWLERYRPLLGALCLLLGFIALINAGYLIHKLVALCAGLLLLGPRLRQVPAIGESLFELARKLRPYEPLIGAAAFVVGLLGLCNIGLLAWP